MHTFFIHRIQSSRSSFSFVRSEENDIKDHKHGILIFIHEEVFSDGLWRGSSWTNFITKVWSSRRWIKLAKKANRWSLWRIGGELESWHFFKAVIKYHMCSYFLGPYLFHCGLGVDNALEYMLQVKNKNVTSTTYNYMGSK